MKKLSQTWVLGAFLSIALSGAGAAQTASSGLGCLPGNWYLDNTDLFVSIVEGLKTSNTGTEFSLEEIVGDYIANIDPDKGEVVVMWQDWTMRGLAQTKNSGSFEVIMKLDGNQYYEITSMDETSMAVALTRDAMNATVTFAGQSFPNPNNTVPRFSGGTWDCSVDALTVTTETGSWNFDRADF